jgi:3-hydroxyisobutyrate dehydrogenase
VKTARDVAQAAEAEGLAMVDARRSDGFDLSEYAAERLAAGGGTRANSVVDACKDAEIVITMLPAGEQVHQVYLGSGGVLAVAPAGALLIDSSTIDIVRAMPGR